MRRWHVFWMVYIWKFRCLGDGCGGIWNHSDCKIRALGSVASKIEVCSVCWEGFWWSEGAFGDPWGPFGDPWRPFGDHLGSIWGPLGTIWGPLGTIWGSLGVLGGTWGVPGGYLGGPWGVPWGYLGALGGSRGVPGDPWGGFLVPFGAECGTVLEFGGWTWAPSGPFLVQNAEL